MTSPERIKTPCVGTCSTVFGDVICRGCKRFIHEVHHWNALSVDEKNTVISRLERLTIAVVSSHLSIINRETLKRTLEAHAVKFNPALAPHCWIHALNTYPLPSSLSWQALGLYPKTPYRNMSIVEVVASINEQFFERSEAWYEWSFKNQAQPDPRAHGPASHSEH